MKTILKIFCAIFLIWIITLIVAVAYFSRSIYVLDFGETQKEVYCQTFSFTPAENTVYCDGEPHFGVQEAGVR